MGGFDLWHSVLPFYLRFWPLIPSTFYLLLFTFAFGNARVFQSYVSSSINLIADHSRAKPSCHAIALASAEAFAKAGHLSRRSLGEGWSLRYLPGRSIERCGATGLDHIITSPQGRTLARHRGEHRRYARCRGDS